MPTVKNEAGAGFQVTASYKTKTGQQAYTIVVNGAVLQVTQVEAGTYHTCAVTTSGVASVSTGSAHTCAVTTSGGLKCWGYDVTGQLGNDAATINHSTPVDVYGLTSGVASVSAGAYHTCAVTTSGGLKCWGDDSQGQLGNDAALTNQPTPVDVAP